MKYKNTLKGVVVLGIALAAVFAYNNQDALLEKQEPLLEQTIVPDAVDCLQFGMVLAPHGRFCTLAVNLKDGK